MLKVFWDVSFGFVALLDKCTAICPEDLTMKPRVFATFAFLISIFAATPLRALDYDAVRDFSLASNNASQVWQYGYSAVDGSGFTNYVESDSNSQLNVWRRSASDMAVVRNTTGHDITYNICTLQQADVLALFPGSDGRKSIVRWLAPASGTYSFQGRFQNIDHCSSDGTILLVRTGQAPQSLIDPIYINSGACNHTDVVSPFFFNLTVNAGDRIDFRLGRGNNDYSYDGTGFAVKITPLPTAPPHGGLSDTFFNVNGQTSGASNVADTVLRFAALQTGTPNGLRVRVQATTTPGNESSWTDLANDRQGRMTYDVARKQFVLNSTDYPRQNGVYFRAISSAPGYTPDSVSNVVPPITQAGFNLVSNKPHLPTTRLFVFCNSMMADLYFSATVASVQSGVGLRIQATTTPADESSWTDLNNGNAGHMTQSTRQSLPNIFLLLVNNYPAAQGLYFRAVASLSGSVDSLSQPVGSFGIQPDVPPAVTIIPPDALPGDGDGSSPDKPILVANGLFSFGATVQSSGPVKHLSLLIDGAPLTEFKDGDTFGSVVTLNVVGDHVLEAYAESNLGGKKRLGAALFIRIVPQTTSATSSTRADSGSLSAASIGHTYTMAQSVGFWNTDSTWKDENGKVNGHPGPNDLAVIGRGQIIGFAQGDDITVQSISINGGQLNGTGVTQTLTVTGTMTITGGSVGGVNIIIQPGATMNLLNASDIIFNAGGGGTVGSVYNHGTINLHGAAGIRGMNVFENTATLNAQRPLTPPLNAATDPLALARGIFAQAPSNSGLITGKVSVLLNQDGSGIVSHDGGTVVSNDGGSIVSHDGGTAISDNGSGLLSEGGAGLLSERGNGLLSSDASGLLSEGGAGFHPVAPGATTGQEAAAATGFTQTGGEIDLSHVIILGPAAINGGVVSGSGMMAGDVTNNGFITPGHPVGGISIIGNYTQGAQGTLVLENGGAAPDQYDHLQVHGTANLNGKLVIRNINGYTPSTLDTFSPLGFNSASGNFSSVSSNTQVTVTANGIRTSVDPSIPPPKAAQPLNISTRMKVLAGDNALIAGFIVTGPNGSTKKVLIRGIGPSLANFGVPGTLSDPLLELHKPDNSTVTNDNWQQGDTSQIPNGFAPGDARESVIVATLAPGNYSAVLKGAHGETGIGLAEVYDLDSSSAAQLANISTRGFVNTGDNVMIGGFIIGGSEPTKVLIRAIGPSLAAFGVQGALPATTLELHDANGAVISNEGWRNTQEADIKATTIPPSNDKEAAILVTLVPGNYTAVVRGKNNMTGIGLVEAYNLQ